MFNTLISDFRRDLNIVYFLLGISPASNCSWPTFRNPISVPSSKAACRVYTQPLKMELIQGSETSANYNLTPGKYPEENIQCLTPISKKIVTFKMRNFNSDKAVHDF